MLQHKNADNICNLITKSRPATVKYITVTHFIAVAVTSTHNIPNRLLICYPMEALYHRRNIKVDNILKFYYHYRVTFRDALILPTKI